MVNLAVVIPTLNERENIVALLEFLQAALTGIEYEVVCVDDQPEGAGGLIRLAALTTATPYVALLDADWEYDGRVLPRMLEKIRSEALDLVVATRDAIEPNGEGLSRHRVILSRFGQMLSGWLYGTNPSARTSGFFLFSRRFLDRAAADPAVPAPRPARFAEVPFVFRELPPESNPDAPLGMEYMRLLLNKGSVRFGSREAEASLAGKPRSEQE